MKLCDRSKIGVINPLKRAIAHKAKCFGLAQKKKGLQGGEMSNVTTHRQVKGKYGSLDVYISK
ncbi:hypothetical protein A1L58_09185 [Shewanella baltica]|nr:hypothetical protein A1L58_09185 [Shewanella baltica]